MRKKKRQRRKQRTKRRAFDRTEHETAGPTPETLAKLETDPLLDMHDAGLIDGAGLRAAEEIDRIYTAITRASMCRSPTMGVLDAGEYDLPDEIAELYRDRMVPWRRSAGRLIAESTVWVVRHRPKVIPPSTVNLCAEGLMRYAVLMAR